MIDCGPPAIPVGSDWSVFGLALFLLGAGSLAVARARAVHPHARSAGGT